MNVYIEGSFTHQDYYDIPAYLEICGDFTWDSANQSDPDAVLLWIEFGDCAQYPHHFAHTAFEIGQYSVRAPMLFVACEEDLSQAPDWLDLIRRADARTLRADTIMDAVRQFSDALYAAMPYRKYLQTSRWEQTRATARKRAGERCQLCNKASILHVHHRTYERRGHEDDEDLIVLCAHCHAKFHNKLAKGGE